MRRSSRSGAWYLAAIAMGGIVWACTDKPTDVDTAEESLPVEDPNQPPPEPPLQAQPFFTCDPDGMGAELAVADVVDRPGDQVVIRQTPTPCRTDLIYRSATTGDIALSSAPDGYLLVEAVDRLVCGSVIGNVAVAGEAHKHQMTGVPIDCALQASNGSWLPMVRIVNPPTMAWAAWIRDLRKVNATTYVVTYGRDFTFQFLTLSDNGRDPADGVYEVTVSTAGDTVTVGSTTKITSDTSEIVLEDPTPGCPVGEYAADNPLCATPEYPGQRQFDGTPAAIDIPWNYNMGQRFTPNQAGVISALGGYYNGTKTVRLYDFATGAVLASVSHTSANEFGYTPVTPVPVASGATYVVAAHMAGSGAAYDGPYPAGAIHDHVRIDCPGTYLYNSTAMPTNCTTYAYGLADVEYRAGAGQYPGQRQFDGIPAGTNIGWDYNMGYRFTALADGRVTGLGGYYNGTKTVRLYDHATGTVLASTAHTSANEFSYTVIEPVVAAAGTTFVVAADMDGSGAAYDGPRPLGATYGDVRIDCPGVYQYNSTVMPTNCTTTYYGMADVEFQR